MTQFPITKEVLQNTMKHEGLYLYAYSITYPVARTCPIWSAYYEKTATQLRKAQEEWGPDAGRKQLQAFLEQGGKKSRFRPLQYILTYDSGWEEERLKVKLFCAFMQGKETFFSKTVTHLWDFSYPTPVCRFIK